MNLMFWKKKSPRDEEAGDTAPGLFARMKARVAALTGRFRTPPPFQAEVDDDGNASRNDSADAGTAMPETGEKSGSRTKLIVGGTILLLLLLAAFGFATWKIFMSSPDHDTDPLKSAAEQHPIAPSRPIVIPASAPSSLSASAAASAAPETATLSAPAETQVSADAQLEALRQKKAELQGMLDDRKLEHPPAPAETEHAGKASGAGDRVAASAEPKVTAHEKSAASSVSQTRPLATAEPPAPSAQTPEAEIAKLRREKAELQRKLNEMRNEQRRTAATSRLHSGQAPVLGGSVTVPSNDPKATVDTLKTAIDAMNAGTGDYQKKPAK
ncbi:MAG TPA: hypothetical protein VFW59_11135 [Gallionella sp.]|nr:hypothetical protein [Gallionella sp.]